MMDKAFIVKEHWGNLILNGSKLWEIRGTGTKIRGRVGVIFSGTGKICGSIEIVESSVLLKEDFEIYRKLHCIKGNFEDLPYRKPHIWHLRNAVRFSEPIPYQHPQGAVIWVNLKSEVVK